jgi:hypothetical protein
MTLTRKERESLVIDLLNKCTPIREIASRAGLSFREIGAIKKKEMTEKETKEGQARQAFASTRAYDLFLQSMTPVQVAIALNIREPEATQYYKEYWNLRQLHNLNWVYEQVKDNIGYFVSLYIAAKVARMDVQHIIRLLEIANNHLPSVEYTYENRKREVDGLEVEKRNSIKIYQEINDKILSMRNRLDSIDLDCERELAQRDQLYQKRMKLQSLVRHFENNNEEYLKIKKTVEEKVDSVLSDRRMALKLALLSLTESMRKNPNKYSHLIYNNTPSAANYNSQYYDTASYGQQQQQQYPSQAYADMLLEEAEKLYNKLAKELVAEIISYYASSTSSSSSLPLVPQFEKLQRHPTKAANQTHVHTEEHRFSQTRIDNDDDNLT